MSYCHYFASTIVLSAVIFSHFYFLLAKPLGQVKQDFVGMVMVWSFTYFMFLLPTWCPRWPSFQEQEAPKSQKGCFLFIYLKPIVMDFFPFIFLIKLYLPVCHQYFLWLLPFSRFIWVNMMPTTQFFLFIFKSLIWVFS